MRGREGRLASPLVILNPEAGRGWVPARVEAIVRSHLPEAELVATEGPGGARRWAAEAAREGRALVVAAGGDGLVGEIVDGLLAAGGGPRLGILPLGTGNDLARAIGIPLHLDRSIRLLANGAPRLVDAGELRTDGSPQKEASLRRFVNMVVAGFGGRLRLRPATKRRWRSAAYVREAIRQLPDLRTHEVRLRLEGEAGAEAYEGGALMVVIANGRRMGGGIQVAPEARLDDGLFDVVVVPDLSPAKLARALAGVLFQRRIPPHLCWWRRARSVRVEGDPPLWLNADGEVLPPQPAAFRILPGALELIVPACRG